MILLRTMVAWATILGLLAGCGQSTGTSDSPRIASRPDVIVTFDGKRRKCLVALSSESQGSAIACDEVVPFVKDELRLPSGSIYDIGPASGSGEAELAKVRASLTGAGYRFIGGPHP
jgi:hypothetical protein